MPNKDNIYRNFYSDQSLQELEGDLDILIDRNSVNSYNLESGSRVAVKRLFKGPEWKKNFC